MPAPCRASQAASAVRLVKTLAMAQETVLLVINICDQGIDFDHKPTQETLTRSRLVRLRF